MMRKKLLLSVLVLAVIGTTNAQNLKVSYQGDLQFGYSAGIGTFAADRINLNMVNGVRINEYFFTGVGLGFDCYTNLDDGLELTLPVFLNAKGYLPVAEKISLFLSMDLGCSIGLTEGMSELNGFMMTPSVGASFNLANSKAITLSLGYNYQSWSAGGLFDINTDALSLKIGYTL